MAEETKIPIKVNLDRPKIPEVSPESNLPDLTKTIESQRPPGTVKQVKVEQNLLKEQESLAQAQVVKKDPRLKFLEDILSEGLGDFYLSFPSETQEKFKVRGEDIALKIDQILSADKFSQEDDAKKIFDLVYDWLSLSGGSGAYLKQEAKLKTDKLIKDGRPIPSNKPA